MMTSFRAFEDNVNALKHNCNLLNDSKCSKFSEMFKKQLSEVVQSNVSISFNLHINESMHSQLPKRVVVDLKTV